MRNVTQRYQNSVYFPKNYKKSPSGWGFALRPLLPPPAVDLHCVLDDIDHQILTEKLNHYEIRRVANELIESYLSDRFQYVELDNANSSRIKIKSDVPQGSILGLLLLSYTLIISLIL